MADKQISTIDASLLSIIAQIVVGNKDDLKEAESLLPNLSSDFSKLIAKGIIDGDTSNSFANSYTAWARERRARLQ